MTTIKNNKKAGVGAAERRGGKKWIIGQPDKGKKVPVHTCVCACRVKVQTERQGARVTSLGKNIDVEHRCCRTSFAVAASFFQIKKKRIKKTKHAKMCADHPHQKKNYFFFCFLFTLCNGRRPIISSFFAFTGEYDCNSIIEQQNNVHGEQGRAIH